MCTEDPYLLNRSAYYPLLKSFKIQNLAYRLQTLLIDFFFEHVSHIALQTDVFRIICHPSTLLVDTAILPGHWYRYLAALYFVPADLLQKNQYWKGINYLKLNWKISPLFSFIIILPMYSILILCYHSLSKNYSMKRKHTSVF